MHPEITNEDIVYAEYILFGKRGVFDRERVDFIKNLDTIDLQAVPGSGKTTALLAKLLILERYLPFKDNAGILVLSHTNVAVEEIRNRIGAYCPRLFSYPNFIGTIQSFVDQFLAVPFFNIVFKNGGRCRIDDEIYNEKLTNLLDRCIQGQQWATFTKVKHIFNSNPKLIFSYRFGYHQNQFNLLSGINGKLLEIKKPRGRSRNYQDYTQDEKNQVLQYLKEQKKLLFKYGVLSFDDAYFFARTYVKKYPRILKVLQKRFRYVFVDEMQDMGVHQVEILDVLFYKKKVKNHAFQRIGDKNQAIFSKTDMDEEGAWKERGKNQKRLFIKGSKRLSPQIAKVVESFALEHTSVNGQNSTCEIPPVLILFNDDSISDVLVKYCELISEYRDAGVLLTSKYPIKAIGGSRKHDDVGKLGITDYLSSFEVLNVSNKVDYPNLKSYLSSIDFTKNTLEAARKNVLNALLRILRLEGIEDDGRFYSKRKLLDVLRYEYPELYSELNLRVYKTSIQLLKGEEIEKEELITVFRNVLITVFQKGDFSNISQQFIEDEEVVTNKVEEAGKIPNTFEHDNVIVQLGTIHSVKGETHHCTLYLETCFHTHESEKCSDQLMGRGVGPNTGKRIKQAARMMYVGLSRPTSLVCFAAHADRINNEMRDTMEENGWRVEEIN